MTCADFEFTSFAFCIMLYREGLWSTLVYLGEFSRGGQIWSQIQYPP